MKIAVASQNFRTVTPHAGRTRRFLVFAVDETGTPVEIDRLDLPREQAFHDFKDDGPHPLDVMDAILAGTCGPGFVRRMAERGIRAAATTETDPVVAIKAFLANPPDPADAAECGHHAHHHTHHHGDGHGRGGGAGG
ncbi:MAG: nitrogen fixation protein [Alphaproteobacteria bacterium]|jgi:predicted Fe-Mo cluster-binding NifX family protein|nr:nitrogen fixation protein [Alphaproteobacteria bacterium]